VMDLSPDVILAHTPATVVALQEATRTIPIVFVQGADPITLGLLPSLASPNGNVTGFMAIEPSLGGKWVQLLRDVAPQMAKAFVLQNPQNPSSSGFLQAVQGVAAAIGVEVSPASIHDLADLERSADAAAGRSAGLIVLPSPEATVQRQRVIDVALRHRLPAIYPFKFFVNSGGLLFYGTDNVDQWRQAAAYIDRIIAGAQPRDLPVQLPTKFDLVINLKTAKLLGLDIPREVLLLADELIE
jgi:putative ABC transport system substrate-binding protein